MKNDKEKCLESIYRDIKLYCEKYINTQFDPNNPIVRLHEPTVNADEIFAATQNLLSTYTTMGKQVREFENQYAQYCGLPYGVMSNSGSSANLLAVAALTNPVTENRLQAGDEVIVSALSWATTIWPLIQYQLIPVIVDCHLPDLNIDIEKLEQAITPKTRAIKLVHVYGNPCNMDAIMSLVKKYNLVLIEDCCEAMGAQYHDKSVGQFGSIGTFSFFFSHHISTLEGGISVTHDFNLAETMRILRAHGWSREADEHQKYVQLYPDIDPRFIFINLGYNLRPTEMNAVMGKIQLTKLNSYIDHRRQTAQYYLSQLQSYSDFFHFQQETNHGKHVWFGFPVILKENTPFTLKEITQYLQQHHIETRPIIAGNMARHPALAMYPHRISGDLSAADWVMKNGFAFACHQAVDVNAREYVIKIIKQFLDQYGCKSTSKHYEKKEIV